MNIKFKRVKGGYLCEVNARSVKRIQVYGAAIDELDYDHLDPNKLTLFFEHTHWTVTYYSGVVTVRPGSRMPAEDERYVKLILPVAHSAKVVDKL